MKPFRETINIDAHFYLDDYGQEITREEFILEMRESQSNAIMLYVGGGFVPLRIAVLTQGDDLSSAHSAFEEWARGNDRLDEINESDPDDEYFGEYESTHQVINISLIEPFLEFEYASALEWLYDWLNNIDDIEHLRHVAITLGSHLDADTIQDDFEHAMDKMGYFTPKVRPMPED